MITLKKAKPRMTYNQGILFYMYSQTYSVISIRLT